MAQRTRRQGGDTMNQTKAKLLRAERRRCPKCGRKSALKFDPYGPGMVCRWGAEGKCDYVNPL